MLLSHYRFKSETASNGVRGSRVAGRPCGVRRWRRKRAPSRRRGKQKELTPTGASLSIGASTRAATPARACTRRGRAPATGRPGNVAEANTAKEPQNPRPATRASRGPASATASDPRTAATASRGPAAARTPSGTVAVRVDSCRRHTRSARHTPRRASGGSPPQYLSGRSRGNGSIVARPDGLLLAHLRACALQALESLPSCTHHQTPVAPSRSLIIVPGTPGASSRREETGAIQDAVRRR